MFVIWLDTVRRREAAIGNKVKAGWKRIKKVYRVNLRAFHGEKHGWPSEDRLMGVGGGWRLDNKRSAKRSVISGLLQTADLRSTACVIF